MTCMLYARQCCMRDGSSAARTLRLVLLHGRMPRNAKSDEACCGVALARCKPSWYEHAETEPHAPRPAPGCPRCCSASHQPDSISSAMVNDIFGHFYMCHQIRRIAHSLVDQPTCVQPHHSACLENVLCGCMQCETEAADRLLDPARLVSNQAHPAQAGVRTAALSRPRQNLHRLRLWEGMDPHLWCRQNRR